MKDRILITGSSGFIGTNLIQYFLNKDFSVLGIDEVKPKTEDCEKYSKNISLLNRDFLEKVVIDFQPDYIVHLAARTDLDGKTLSDYSANIEGVDNLLKIAERLPNLKKIIIASSMLVCHAGYYPKDKFDYAPTTVYGESKVETEKIVWANKPKCDWAIIRPTSIWGPWFGAPYRNFFDMVISKKYFHIGNKSCTKTYGYVGNAIYQIEKILFTPTINEENKIFFIGDDPATNIEEWGNEIANQLNYKIKKVPYFAIKCAAIFGDILGLAGVRFPMTSFRLKNMTTDNLIDLSATYIVAPAPPFTRIEGVKNTLNWLNKQNVIK